MEICIRPAYPADLTDEEWEVIEPFLPPPCELGREREVSQREIVNAIRYVQRAGCAWRLLPHDFPKRETVYWWFRRWIADGTWQRMHDRLRETFRAAAGREDTPSAAIVDSQSVKTTERGGRGYDAGKKIIGRKRHVLADALGLMWGLLITPANVQDRDAVPDLLRRAWDNLPRLQTIWADGAYAGELVEWVHAAPDWRREGRRPGRRPFV